MNCSIALISLKVLATSQAATVYDTSTKTCIWSGFTSRALMG
ncbi:hypothetical protein [Catenibacterium mitsuokai]|nr:hypothetical protein [Catenibacterium mitsuokai]